MNNVELRRAAEALYHLALQDNPEPISRSVYLYSDVQTREHVLAVQKLGQALGFE